MEPETSIMLEACEDESMLIQTVKSIVDESNQNEDEYFLVTEVQDGHTAQMEVVDEETMSVVNEPHKNSTWSEMCRICANVNDHLIPIFEGEGAEHGLCSKIHKHLPIHVSETDSLPLQLCYHCAATLLAWHELAEGCVDAEHRLLQIQTELQQKQQYFHATSLNGMDQVTVTTAGDVTNDSNRAELLLQHRQQVQVKGEASEESVTNDSERFGVPKKKSFAAFRSAQMALLSRNSSAQLISKHMESEAQDIVDPLAQADQVKIEMEYSDGSSPNSLEGSTDSEYNPDSATAHTQRRNRTRSLPRKSLVSSTECLTIPAERSFFCKTCQRVFKRQFHFKRHIASCREKTNTKSDNDELESITTAEMALLSRNSSTQFISKSPRSEAQDIVDPLVQAVQCSQVKVEMKNFDDSSLDSMERSTDSEYNPNSTTTCTQRKNPTRPFFCKACRRVFKREFHFKRHVASCREKSITKSNNDDDDDLESITTESLLNIEHVETGNKSTTVVEHGDVKKSSNEESCSKSRRKRLRSYPCMYCDYSAKKKKLLDLHSLECHPEFSVKNHTKKLRNIDKETVKRARMEVDGRVYYHCNECGKNLYSPYTFSWHIRIHTGERPFTCHLCGKQFRVNQGLARHLRETHAGIKKFPCDICGRMFSTKRNAEDHRRIHTGERPYVCNICKKAFKQKASLFVHNRTHTDFFPFKCGYCDQGFRTRPPLMVHITKHTGEKPHACDICQRRFRIKYELKRHRLIHFDEKPWQCTDCGLSFRQKRYLVNHTKINHNANASLSTHE